MLPSSAQRVGRRSTGLGIDGTGIRGSGKWTDFVNEKWRVQEKLDSLETSTDEQFLKELSSRRLRVHRSMESTLYQLVSTVFTAASVVLVTQETDRLAAGEQLDVSQGVAGMLCTAFFGLDVLLMMFVYQRHFLSHAMNVMVDIALELMGTGMPNLFASLKIVRFLRLGRVIRHLSEFRDLYLMLMGMVSAARATMFGWRNYFLAKSGF